MTQPEAAPAENPQTVKIKQANRLISIASVSVGVSVCVSMWALASRMESRYLIAGVIATGATNLVLRAIILINTL